MNTSKSEFPLATAALGHLRRFAEWTRTADPETIANGLLQHEHDDARQWVLEIDAWLDRFITRI